jgi:hypothetical protein
MILDRLETLRNVELCDVVDYVLLEVLTALTRYNALVIDVLSIVINHANSEGVIIVELYDATDNDATLSSTITEDLGACHLYRNSNLIEGNGIQQIVQRIDAICIEIGICQRKLYLYEVRLLLLVVTLEIGSALVVVSVLVFHKNLLL